MLPVGASEVGELLRGLSVAVNVTTCPYTAGWRVNAVPGVKLSLWVDVL